MKRRVSALFLALLLLLSLPACGGKEPPVEAEKPTVDMTPVVKDPPAVEPPVEEEVYEGPWNPLTGLPCETDLSNARPYAIMLNNLQKALPQYGVAKADIIYEVPAEGGITRMLGIFTDITDLGNVGSIRSARDYYVQIARGHDALYVHAGGSPGAYDLIANAGIDSIDGIKGAYNAIFWRDATRKAVAGYEHSLFLTASELKAYAEENRTMTHRDGYVPSLTFAADGTPDGEAAANVKVTYYSGGKTTAFSYDEAAGGYLVSQYNGKYVDGQTGEQLLRENVLVLFCNINKIAGDSAGRLSVDIVGSGTGYFACGGKYTEICWSKSTATSEIVYTLADGSPLTLGAGTSYVCVAPLGASASFE